MLVAEDMALIFDSRPSWSLYEDAEGNRLLERYSGMHGDAERPLWQALFPADLKTAQVRVSGQLIRTGELGFGYANPLCYPLDQLLMLHLLPTVDTILIPGACVDFGAGAEVYAGVSGAGKTTFTRMIAECESVTCETITDDRVLLVKTPDGWLAGGTPWPGEGRNVMSTWRPLRAIHFLRQGSEEKFIPISAGRALEAMLPMVSVPWFDVVRITAMLDLCGDVVESHPCSDFVFRRDPVVGHAAKKEGLKPLCAEFEPTHVEGDVVCTS